MYGRSFSIHACMMAIHGVGLIVIYFTSQENSHNSQLGNSVGDPELPSSFCLFRLKYGMWQASS